MQKQIETTAELLKNKQKKDAFENTLERLDPEVDLEKGFAVFIQGLA